jgi:hypothetical protein
MSMAEALYLPLVGGLMVTMRHFLKNLFNPGVAFHHQLSRGAPRLQPPLSAAITS